MQLKKRKAGISTMPRIGGSLAAATAALLGSGTSTQLQAQELTPWEMDAALLYYGESDGRVRDVSVNALARKELKEDSFLSLTLAVDTLTGASPSGAVPSDSVQSFTRPSGNGTYQIGAGERPLDDSFHDSRTALSASWEQPVGRLAKLNVGTSLSSEFDYMHAGLNAQIARDFNNRNTTLSFGLALANDSVNPVGGSPVPMSEMLGVGDLSNKRGDESKDVTDLLLGVTQVINRQTLVQFNYSLSQSNGYLTDPYKILSVVDPVTGIPVAGPVGSGLNRYLYESRPDQREKQSLFGLLKRDFNGNTLDLSYRYMTDDWGVDSQTIDLHYRWRLGDRQYLQPHIRFYTQTDADFYHAVLFDGDPVPQFATADYRLGEFDALTLGLKYGRETERGEWAARLELYRQTGKGSSAANVGALAAYDLYTDLTAVIAQFSYGFGGY